MDSFFQYLLESAVCLALFYSIFWALMKNETFFGLNRFYLIFSLFASFLIPLFNITSPFRTQPPIVDPYGFSTSGDVSASGFNLLALLILIYLLGVAVLLMRFGYQLFYLFHTAKKCGIKKTNGFRFIFMDNDITPFSFFNYVFLNKSKMSGQDFNRIVSHELIHIKQYHSIDILIMELVTIFHWFNPFVWPYKKSLKETHEYLADNGVIAQGCSPTRYQMLIVEQHVGVKLFEFANNFKHSQIKRRITMMTKIKSKSWAKLKVLLILPLASLLVLAFAESKPAAPDLTEIHAAADSVPPIFTAPQENTDKDKKLAELKKKYKALAAELEKTTDPKKRDTIKKEMEMLKMKASENGDNADKNGKKTKMEIIKAKYAELETALKKTDDPKKKEKIKAEMAKLKEMANKEKQLAAKEKSEENGDLTEAMLEKEIKSLKVKYEKTEDPEEKAAIKKKLKQLMAKKESLK